MVSSTAKFMFVTFCFRYDLIGKFVFVTGLSDLTLTTDIPDAGDEDVFMVKRFLFSINFNLKTLIILKKKSYSEINHKGRYSDNYYLKLLKITDFESASGTT